MNRISRTVPAAIVVLTGAIVAATGVGLLAGPKREKESASEPAPLCRALERALTEDQFSHIEAYGEDPNHTMVLLRTAARTMRFSAKTGTLEEVQHASPIGPINRISFERTDDGAEWVLWYNGRRQCTIGVGGDE